MPRIRVLVVDDSVVIRRIVSDVVSQDPDLELAGWASNGKLALERIPQVNPDCITLDVEMPGMDGIETLTEIRKTHPHLPVIMFSTLTERGAAKTIEALSRGATDYVAKPANVGSVNECMAILREELLPKIKAYSVTAGGKLAATKLPPRVRPVRKRGPARVPAVVCIASSTGGPKALTDLIRPVAAGFPVPLVIVQHMPPVFTNLFAKRLNELAAIEVTEAAQGEIVRPGHAYIAPGGKHFELQKSGNRVLVELTEGPPENSCRPAADVLFRSAVQVYGGAVLGVVLTGMGQDGLRGCELIAEAGGQILAQDQASSVVWGMPGAVAQAGIADRILPLDEMAQAITAKVCGAVPHVS